MQEPICECLNWEHAWRVQSNKIVVVTKQCLNCGRSLGNVKKDQFDLTKIPRFDESRLLAWREKHDAWRKEEQRLFALKQNQWFVEYNQYLQSGHWRHLRKIVLLRDPICQRCFENPSQQAHHISYEGYKKFGFSFAVECAGMCTPCHDLIHGRDAL